MFSKLLLVLTAIVVAVCAQGTTTSGSSPAVPSLDSCTVQCLANAATQDGCVSYTNISCVCTNPQFQADAGGCIAQNCGTTDLQNALALQSAECSAAGLSATGPSATPSPVPFTSSSASGSVTSSSGSAAASGTSVAGGTSVTGGTGVTGGTSGAGASTASIPTASPTNVASTASSPASPTTSAASSSTSSSAADSLAANGGVAALMALIAGFLAM